MERIWLKSYPEGVPADINPTAYASIGDFFAAKRRPLSRPDRLRLHGPDDDLRRPRSSVARVRGLSAERRLPAARRARRADDAEPAAISGRAVRRAARGLRRSSTATRSTRRASCVISSKIPAPRRSSSWRTSPRRWRRRSTDTRLRARHRHRRGRSPRPARAAC